MVCDTFVLYLRTELKNMAKYRIEVISEEGKPDSFQPQVLFGVVSELQPTPKWTNIIRWFDSSQNPDRGVRLEKEVELFSHSYCLSEKEALEVINLHKAQSEPKVKRTYINVE